MTANVLEQGEALGGKRRHHGFEIEEGEVGFPDLFPALQPPPGADKAFPHLFDRTNMKPDRLFHRAPRARFTSARKSAIRASKGGDWCQKP